MRLCLFINQYINLFLKITFFIFLNNYFYYLLFCKIILLILNKSNNKYKETMITTFEDQTHPLTDYELKTLLPLMIQGFTTKIGKTRSVTNAQICKALNNKGYDVNEPRIRKLVFYIRQQNLVPNLIASSKGYWIATDINEVDTWIDSLQSRIDAIKETLNYATKLKENFSDLNY